MNTLGRIVFSSMAFQTGSGASPFSTRASLVHPLEVRQAQSLRAPVKSAIRAASGLVYLLMEGGNVIPVGPDGNVKGRYHLAGAVAVSEGKRKVYVASKEKALVAFHENGEEAWRKDMTSEFTSPWHKPSNPTEDETEKVWFSANGKLMRLSDQGETVEKVQVCSTYDFPILFDSRNRAYTHGFTISYGMECGAFIDSRHITRISPDLKTSTFRDVSCTHLFLLDDQPYALHDEKIVKLDFDQKKETPIYSWKKGLIPLPPVVRDGKIHLVLFPEYGNAAKAAYVVLTRNGKVKEERLLRFEIQDRSDPVLTPEGTLFVLGKKNRLYAVDRQGLVHAHEFSREPAGIFPGTGEKVLVVLKDGSVLTARAKGAREMAEEAEEAWMDDKTGEAFGDAG